MDDNVLISVDPHKASATVAVLDPMTRTPLEGARFANTAAGYLELRRFARRWRRRSWAIEGGRGAGRSLSQRPRCPSVSPPWTASGSKTCTSTTTP